MCPTESFRRRRKTEKLYTRRRATSTTHRPNPRPGGADFRRIPDAFQGHGKGAAVYPNARRYDRMRDAAHLPCDAAFHGSAPGRGAQETKSAQDSASDSA